MREVTDNTIDSFVEYLSERSEKAIIGKGKINWFELDITVFTRDRDLCSKVLQRDTDARLVLTSKLSHEIGRGGVRREKTNTAGNGKKYNKSKAIRQHVDNALQNAISNFYSQI